MLLTLDVCFRKLLPKNPNEVKKVWVCVYLSPNRGFLVYETSTQSKHVSIISIDLNNEVYEFVGCSQEFLLKEIECYYEISCLDGFLVLIKGFSSSRPSTPQLHVFKFDYSFSKINSHRTVVVPRFSGLFHSINGKLICFKRVSNRRDGAAVGNFTFIENDNSFVEIENTNVHLKQEQFYPVCL